MAILLQQVNYLLDRHEKLYGKMAGRLSPQELLLSVFVEMNVNSFGRAMAYFIFIIIIIIINYNI